MRKRHSINLFLWIWLTILFLLSNCVLASETANVLPLNEAIWSIDLKSGDYVDGVVSSNPALGVFYVVSPEQETVVFATPISNIEPVGFSFSAAARSSREASSNVLGQPGSFRASLEYHVISSVC